MAKRPKKRSASSGAKRRKNSSGSGSASGGERFDVDAIERAVDEEEARRGEVAGSGSIAQPASQEAVNVGVAVNSVEVDQDKLAAEADAIGLQAATAEHESNPSADAPQAQLALPGEGDDALPVGESWETFCNGAIGIVSITLLQQWQLSQEEQSELGKHLGACMDQLMPGGLAGKYACWANLLMCCAGVVVSRSMQNGGKLPGLGPKAKRVVEPAAVATAPSAPATPTAAPPSAPSAPKTDADNIASILGTPKS